MRSPRVRHHDNLRHVWSWHHGAWSSFCVASLVPQSLASPSRPPSQGGGMIILSWRNCQYYPTKIENPEKRVNFLKANGETSLKVINDFLGSYTIFVLFFVFSFHLGSYTIFVLFLLCSTVWFPFWGSSGVRSDTSRCACSK